MSSFGLGSWICLLDSSWVLTWVSWSRQNRESRHPPNICCGAWGVAEWSGGEGGARGAGVDGCLGFWAPSRWVSWIWQPGVVGCLGFCCRVGGCLRFGAAEWSDGVGWCAQTDKLMGVFIWGEVGVFDLVSLIWWVSLIWYTVDSVGRGGRLVRAPARGALSSTGSRHRKVEGRGRGTPRCTALRRFDPTSGQNVQR